MKAHQILGSPPFVLLGVLLARSMPRRLGHWLARRVAKEMARRRSDLFRRVRANLVHVMGPGVDAAELDRMAEQAIYHAGCTYVDVFRTSPRDHQRGRSRVWIAEEEWPRARDLLAGSRGTVVVGPHLSNFDLLMQWFRAQGGQVMILGLAAPNAGTRLLNQLREKWGVQVDPITPESLRRALAVLRGGGLVATGGDRPASPNDEFVLFFDAPARLPSGPVRLALQTGARVIVAACWQEPSGKYGLHFSLPLEMETTGDRPQDIRHNTRRVAERMEEMIRRCPEQWLMFVPVWTDG